MPEFQCSAVLFDLDGVLVDSTKSVVVVWSAWAEKNGIPPAKALEIVHGLRTIEGVRRLAPHLDAETEAQKIESAITIKKGGTIAIAGAGNFLRDLPQGSWCVVTSGLRKFAEIRLNDADLPVPDVLVSAEDVTIGKPHPEPYLTGARLMRKTPDECLVFEDAVSGIRSARAAGIRVIGVATTFTPDELREADAVIPNLSPVRVSLRDGKLHIHV